MKNIHFNQYVEDALSNKEGRINGEIYDREKVVRGYRHHILPLSRTG